MDNENFYQLTYNTSGTASAVLAKNDTVDKVYVEERFTNMKDNIPLISLKDIADEKCISHMGITSTDDYSGNEWAVLTKFFSIYSGSTNKEDSQIVTHQESHYLQSLSAALNSGLTEPHIFCFTKPVAQSEYGKPHESIFLMNPKRGVCQLAFRQVLGPNVQVKREEGVPNSYYNRKTFSICNAFECIKEFTNCSTLKEMYAVGQLGNDDKMIPSILSKCGAQTSQFKLDGKKQIFNDYEYINSEEYDGQKRRDIYLNLLYRIQKDYERYLINAVKEYFGSQTRDVASTSKELIITGTLSDNVRANYLLLKSLDDDFTLYVDPISNEVSNSMGLAYELIGSCEMSPKGVNNFYLGRELNPNDYNLLEQEDEKTVTPKEVAELIADGNVVAIAQGRSEITDHALGNRSIVADPRTIESKQILSRSKYQPDHIPCITSVLEESASDWFDMDKLKSSPEAMYAVDALDVTKEQAQGAVYTDGSTRVQTVNEGYNQNYYNLIKEFGDLTGVPMLLNTSLNMHTYPICDNMENIMSFMRCSGVNYLYLPEAEKLLFIPSES